MKILLILATCFLLGCSPNCHTTYKLIKGIAPDGNFYHITGTDTFIVKEPHGVVTVYIAVTDLTVEGGVKLIKQVAFTE